MAALVQEMSSEGEVHGGPWMLRMSWRFGHRVYLFLRAMVWLILTGLGALADQYQLVDVQNFVRTTFASSTKLTLIVVAVTVLWLAVTHLTRGQKGFSAKGNLDEGE
ncbi:hypothetical protein [Bradyrhizobium sp. Ec3.3]|uniref:hypothetical protein n=1 Tax=Bradyrhizobium sp. Ec3.3 TaxID=189753 RepID=UPI0003FA842C|nr:hypothetical protein [Bradyrhizobium sp. Ec3.3]